MIEETGRVIEVCENTAWVETEGTAGCSGCAAKTGCGTAVFARVFGARRNRVQALNPMQARSGERVVIGLDEDALVRGSLLVYAVPLAGLLAGASFGQLVGGTEPLSILCAALGFAGGCAWGGRLAQRISGDKRYQAVILRRVTNVSDPVVA